jgi:hypothetical protein
MTPRIPCAIAIALSIATASTQTAFAQANVSRPGGNTPRTMYTEDLPAGRASAGPPQAFYGEAPMQGGFVVHGSPPGVPSDYQCVDGCDSGCYDSGCGDYGCCDTGCCDSCDSDCCKTSCCVYVDYLNVRANFSEATAFIEQDLANGTDTFVPLDFGYESSFRIGAACRMCGCGDEVRFLYTRLTGDASDVAFPGDIVPFGADPPPGGRTLIDADVEVNAFDIEFAKRIPLGGAMAGGGCGSGCGSGCGRSCPAWDVTWAGGVRIADAGWERSYTALDNTDFAVTDVDTEMDFRGAGLKTGLEGRRYFFKDGWFSIYAKGDLSLLVGDFDLETTRTTDDGIDQITVRQEFSNREVIPVTDLEAGFTTQITCHGSFSAGYLLSAWHDLGFRNAIDVCDCDPGANLSPLLSSHHDDANILGFDGFFARLEWCF